MRSACMAFCSPADAEESGANLRCSRRGPVAHNLEVLELDLLWTRQLALLNSVSEDTESERLDCVQRLVAGSPVCHRTRQIDDIGDPAAILFLLGLDLQRHGP